MKLSLKKGDYTGHNYPTKHINQIHIQGDSSQNHANSSSKREVSPQGLRYDFKDTKVRSAMKVSEVEQSSKDPR